MTAIVPPEPPSVNTPAPTIYRGACEKFELVTARKSHRCDFSRDTSWFRGCAQTIQPGQKYVRVTTYPGHDVVEVSTPSTGACCLACADGYTHMDTLSRGVA